ncbi:MAG: hypothetical protein ACRC4M_04785 [Mycoplasma sp.]
MSENSITKGFSKYRDGIKNQDRLLIGSNYFLIIDGATPLIKTDSNVDELHFFLDYIIDNFEKTLREEKTFQKTMKKLLKEVSPSLIEEYGPTAGCCFGIWENNEWKFNIIGDCKIYYKKENNIFTLEDEALSILDQGSLEIMERISKETNKPFLECVFEGDCMKRLQEVRSKQNQKDGYAILSKDIDIDKIKTTGEKNVDEIIACSDGFDEYICKWENNNIKLVFEKARNGLFFNMVEELEKKQKEDSKCESVRRFKTHDDTTAVYLDFIKTKK